MTRKRIRLAAVPSDDAANIWADVEQDGDGDLGVHLLHVYPDLSPAVGWWLLCDGKEYEVFSAVAVADDMPFKMLCQPKAGAS